jgi:4,5-DOPA dioxygenase extradiol
MPVLFVGHGSPMNAIEHNAFTETLRGLSARLPRPRLCAWSRRIGCLAERRCWHPRIREPLTISKASRVLSLQCSIPRPALLLKRRNWQAILRLLPTTGGVSITAGGVCCAICIRRPTCPAFQLSLDERRSFKEHLDLGREVQSLRERGVLILGSGNIVHSLRRIDWDHPASAYDWAVEFDARVKEAVEAHDGNSLVEPQKWGDTLLANAHPTVEHYLPLLYCVGSTDEGDAVSHPYQGFNFGSISMRMILFGAAVKPAIRC